MENSKIKIQFSDSIEGFAISAEALSSMSNGYFNYMQTFKIVTPQFTWHGPVFEAADDQSQGHCLIVGEELAEDLGIEEGDSVEMNQSRQDPIQRMQLKSTKKKGTRLPFFSGIELGVGQIIKYKEGPYVIKSMDPTNGFVSDETSVEIIDEKGTIISQSPTPLAGSSGQNHGFSSLIGMDNVIEELKVRMITPIKSPSLVSRYMRKPLKGAIIHGPYGVGKTSLARAIKHELGIPFIEINLSDILEMGPSIIKAAYKIAAESEQGGIIYLDEIDKIAPRDIDGISLLAAILQKAMDGFSSNPKVYTLATTNNLSGVAEALLRPGRLDEIIEMRMPDKSARAKLFSLFLSSVKTDKSIDVSVLAEKTPAFSGADIESVCKKAGAKKLSDHVNTSVKQVITQKGLLSEITTLEPTGARILGVQKPKFSFDDMYGAEKLKKRVMPLLDLMSGKVQSQYATANGTTLLLHGPPGTGKTMFAQCMANKLGYSFKYQGATSFKSMWVGNTEANIRRLFSNARIYKPIVIFLDEIDSLGKNRTPNSPHSADALNELLVELDGIANNTGVFIVAATNRKDILDPALLSRFSWNIEMPLPDENQRQEILQGLFQELPTSTLDYAYLARQTTGWSQRDLAGLKREIVTKLALQQVSVVSMGTLQNLIVGRPAVSSLQHGISGRAL